MLWSAHTLVNTHIRELSVSLPRDFPADRSFTGFPFQSNLSSFWSCRAAVGERMAEGGGHTCVCEAQTQETKEEFSSTLSQFK